MSAGLLWHGHSAFQIITPECSVLIDPFFSGNPSAVTAWDAVTPPDIVLVTHMHGDHVGDAVQICRKFKARLGCVVGVAEALIKAGVPAELVIGGIGFNIGGTVEEKGVRITMTEATHTSEAGVAAGFIITLPDGYTLYHAGDTGIFASMAVWGALYPLDLALLPIGGFYTMDARQAAAAAKSLQAKAVVPMHWKTFPVLTQNTAEFQAELARTAPDCRYIGMLPGESIPLGTR